MRRQRSHFSAEPQAIGRRRSFGAVHLGGGRTLFRAWAPRAERVEVRLVAPEERALPMERGASGWHEIVAEGAGPGTRYLLSADGRDGIPDPASALQPEGVHGPSEVDGDDFDWTDGAFRCPPLRELVLYEVHVGAFTPEGTFDAAALRLDELVELGVTMVELMPVSAFPGERNWGYDGVLPWSVQASYGGPAGLRRFVDACHGRGLGVCLDVVHNHLGPEGNRLDELAPFFTEKYHTPWGRAVNFDGAGSDEVRLYFVESAVRWFRDFHVDALRLDAVHAIFDQSACPFLQELTDAVHAEGERLGRRALVIAESDLGDPRLVRVPEVGGFGMDAQWSDDFHHAVHALVTGEREGYYADFGGVEHLALAIAHGYAYTGQRSVYRGRRHGAPTEGIPDERFVACVQNHDQVGNRALGERLASFVDLERLKLAAGALLTSPFVPLLFMGEEWGEEQPFLYFTSHGDPELAEAVHRGRREEFSAFGWGDEVPDPQARETFERSVLDRARRDSPRGRALLAYHRELLRLRRELPALLPSDRTRREVWPVARARAIAVLRRAPDAGGADVLVLLGFGDEPADVGAVVPPGAWRRVLDSADELWAGPGGALPDVLPDGEARRVRIAPASCVVLAAEH